MPLRILLADDHTLFRKGIENLISSREEFEVVGGAKDGLEAIMLARSTHPDLILMDVNMPHCNGLEAVRIIKEELPEIKIVMLTVSDDCDKLFEAIKSGAQGYLLKDLEPYQLFDMLEGILHGESAVSGLMVTMMLEQIAQEKHSTPEVALEGEVPQSVELGTGVLSAREKEVLGLIASGKSNHEIAEELIISINTVKNHISNMLTKLNLNNRVQLAVYASRQHLNHLQKDQ